MGMLYVKLLALGLCCTNGSLLPDVSEEHAAVTWYNHHAGVYRSKKRCKAFESILCLEAAKVYKKVPSLLLSADSYHLPYVRYINDLVAEFPLGAHTLVSSLTALNSAPTKQVQPCLETPADSQQSVVSTAVTSEAPASAAAGDAAATAAPPTSTAVPSVNAAVPPATKDGDASAIPLSSSTPITHSFFDMTSTSRADFVLWPRPSPSDWQDIRTVVLRACVTLEWFGNSDVQARLDQQGKGPNPMYTLVHQLLVGHVMDPHLDMQQVVRSFFIQITPYIHIADGAVPVIKSLHACL